MQKLSFATYSADGRVACYWAPKASGDWAADNAAGRAYAAEAIHHISANDATPVLGFIMKAMVSRGEFGGVEAGFSQRMAQRAVETG